MQTNPNPVEAQATSQPTVPAIAHRRGGVWQLKIKCPFCRKTHHHGGGDGDLPILGSRVPHCTDGEAHPCYVLVGSRAADV